MFTQPTPKAFCRDTVFRDCVFLVAQTFLPVSPVIPLNLPRGCLAQYIADGTVHCERAFPFTSHF